jgi:CRP/FNR family transcriptional regulator
MVKDIQWYLQHVFTMFEPALKKKVEEVGIIRSFEAGDVIMRTGQYIGYTTLIAEGRIKLYREGDDGEEFFMYYLEAGTACAMSMICAARQDTSQMMAKAVEKSIAIMIPIQLMNELMSKYPSWYRFVIENYRSRFEELLLVLDNVVFKGMDERLEFYLKQQAVRMGRKEIQLTHQEIANDLNTAREVVSRLLKKLEQTGKVRLHRNFIELLE